MVQGEFGARAGILVLLLCWHGAGAALGGEPSPSMGSAQAGRSYANAVCAPCHAIERGAKSSPDVKATPFALLVKSEKLTTHDIESWLTSSHSAMPDFAVPAEKRADLIAYIKSLALAP